MSKNTGKLFIILYTLSVMLFSAASAGAAPEVKTFADRKSVLLGDMFVFTVDVAGAPNAEQPILPKNIDYFDIQYLGRRQEMRSSLTVIVNGERVRDERTGGNIRFQYAFIPKEAGQFTIPSFPINVEGYVYHTEPIYIEVVDKVQRSNDIFLLVEADKTNVYLGEKIAVTFKWYFSKSIDNHRLNIPWVEKFENFLVTDPERDDAHLYQRLVVNDNIPVPVTKKREFYKGREYLVISFEKIFVPLSAGSYTLPSALLKCDVVKGYQSSRSRSFFDEFFDTDFDSFFGRRRAITEPFVTRSNGLTFDVREVPAANKPSNYAGAVGTFDFKAYINPSAVKVGDPITLSAQISGSGNIDQIMLPPVPPMKYFKSYEPEHKAAEYSKDDALTGTKQFEMVLIPKIAGNFEIPELVFTYFDPAKGAYQTIAEGPFPVEVTEAPKEEVFEPQIVPAQQTELKRPKSKVELVKKDIHYIRPDLGEFIIGQKSPFYRQPGKVVTVFFAPLLLIGVVRIFATRSEKMKTDIAYARNKLAFSKFQKNCASLKKSLKKKNFQLFYEEASKSLTEYIADKTNISQASAHYEAQEALGARRLSAGLIDEAIKLGEKFSGYKFSGGQISADEARSDLKRLENTVKRLERELK